MDSSSPEFNAYWGSQGPIHDPASPVVRYPLVDTDDDMYNHFPLALNPYPKTPTTPPPLSKDDSDSALRLVQHEQNDTHMDTDLGGGFLAPMPESPHRVFTEPGMNQPAVPRSGDIQHASSEPVSSLSHISFNAGNDYEAATSSHLPVVDASYPNHPYPCGFPSSLPEMNTDLAASTRSISGQQQQVAATSTSPLVSLPHHRTAQPGYRRDSRLKRQRTDQVAQEEDVVTYASTNNVRVAKQVDLCSKILAITDYGSAETKKQAAEAIVKLLASWQKRRGGKLTRPGFKVGRKGIEKHLRDWFDGINAPWWNDVSRQLLTQTECEPLKQMLVFELLFEKYDNNRKKLYDDWWIDCSNGMMRECKLCPEDKHSLSKNSDFPYYVHHLVSAHLDRFLQPDQGFKRTPSAVPTVQLLARGPKEEPTDASAGRSALRMDTSVEHLVRLAVEHQNAGENASHARLNAKTQAIADIVRPYVGQPSFSAMSVNTLSAVEVVHDALRSHLQKKGNDFRRQLIQDRMSHLPRPHLFIDRVNNGLLLADDVRDPPLFEADMLGDAFSQLRLEADPPSFVFDIHRLMKEYADYVVPGTEYSLLSLTQFAGFSALGDSLNRWSRFLEKIDKLVRFIRRDPTNIPGAGQVGEDIVDTFKQYLEDVLVAHPARLHCPDSGDGVDEDEEKEDESDNEQDEDDENDSGVETVESDTQEEKNGEEADGAASVSPRLHYNDFIPHLRYIIVRVLQCICSQHRTTQEVTARAKLEMEMIAAVVGRWSRVSGRDGTSILQYQQPITMVHLFYTAACNGKRTLLNALKERYPDDYDARINEPVASGWTALTTCIARASDREQQQSNTYYDIAMDIAHYIGQRPRETVVCSKSSWSPISLALRMPELAHAQDGTPMHPDSRTRLRLITQLCEIGESGAFCTFDIPSSVYPLHEAIRARDQPLFNLLLPKTFKSDLDRADFAGLTAIFLAANSGQEQMVTQLLARRPNLHLLNDTFKSVTMRCREMGEHTIADLIEEHIRFHNDKPCASSSKLPICTAWD